MSQSNAKILLTLLGILLIVGAVFLVVRPKKEAIDTLKGEINELQARYDDLCEKEKHKDEFLQETADFNKHFDEVLVDYPADLNQESTVMFLKGCEEANEYENLSVALPRPSTYYVLGEGAADATTDASSLESDSYVVETESYTISYQGSYDGLKDYLKYIADYKYRLNISQINIAYAQDAEQPVQECSGSLTLNAFSISGPNRTPDKPSVDVEEGKDVIFADENGGFLSASSFDENEGADIVANHSVMVLLNSADNDMSSGIIVAANESNEETYVTSSNNSVENLTFNITSEDDKKYVEYKIGSESYKTEVLSSSVTIYVKSSARVNDDDKNGVDVTINNDTDLGVYIKVADDDSSKPRFNVKSKTGNVKIY